MPRLIKKIIDAATPPAEGQAFVRDSELKGFAVRLTPGSKTFVLERVIRGRFTRLSLGRYGVLTLDQARDMARKRAVEIREGHDPVAERRQGERQQSRTFQALEKLYLEQHAIHKKTRNNDVSMLNKWLHDLRPRRLNDITREDVCALHAEIGSQGKTYAANRTIRLVCTMFNFAKDQGWYSGTNPASRIKKFKEKKRDRFVTPAELPRLWRALQNEPNPYVRGAFFIGLLTGARRSEVLAMKWEDLDLQRRLWRIPDTKTDEPHTIPLPLPVIEEIGKLPRLEGNRHVFCGRWGRSHLVNISKPWNRIRKEAGLADVRIHDLRRTLGSWLVAEGASLPLIGKALNHKDQATTAIYARLQLDPVRAALEANAMKMLGIVGKNERGTDEP